MKYAAIAAPFDVRVCTILPGKMGRACPPCPGVSEIDLLGYRERVVYLDAEIAHRALDLSYHDAIDWKAVRSDVFDFATGYVTTSELAVDSEIEHGEIACSPLDLHLVRTDQTCLVRKGGFEPINLPLFHWTLASFGSSAATRKWQSG